ncbi:MAG: hypothetical protein RUMPE_00876 [Eubacteriales bacterium SKADARSKE-1]|nr:hypothetical protein [Eubacteriales bacterium SKADARSKE-1]
MTYIAETVNGDLIDLKQPLEVTLNQAEEAPADDISAVFPINKKIEELKNISIYSNFKKIFYGLLDTQKTSCTPSGTFLNITARSMAALLLDNEACPQTYSVPSLLIIFNRHIRPYGFTSFSGDSKQFPLELVVSKGMSEWEVLETFCTDYLRVYPRINSDMTINATRALSINNIVFSNKGQGIKYNYIYENIKRHKLYSEVFVRATKDGAYSLEVKDKDAINRGINTKRYLNAIDSIKTPTVCGEIMLQTAQNNAYEICVVCPGEVSLNIGDKATINDTLFGAIKNLVVSKIKYTLDSMSERTEVFLQRGDI